jgi:hypothetical protein
LGTVASLQVSVSRIDNAARSLTDYETRAGFQTRVRVMNNSEPCGRIGQIEDEHDDEDEFDSPPAEA